MTQGQSPGEHQPILRQRPLPTSPTDEAKNSDTIGAATSLRDLARALWPHWTQAPPPSFASDDVSPADGASEPGCDF